MDKSKSSLFEKFKRATATNSKTVHGKNNGKKRNRKRHGHSQNQQQTATMQRRASPQPHDPLKIKVTGDPNNHHSSALKVSNFPTNLKTGKDGVFKWFMLDGETNDFSLIKDHSLATFQPNIDHIGCRISCQWVPFESEYPSSNFAEFGPLVCEPTIKAEVTKWSSNTNSELSWDILSEHGVPAVLTLDTEDHLTLTSPCQPINQSSNENSGGGNSQQPSPDADATREEAKSEDITIKLTHWHMVVLLSSGETQLEIIPAATPKLQASLSSLSLTCLSSRDRDVIALVLRARIETLRAKELKSIKSGNSEDVVRVRIEILEDLCSEFSGNNQKRLLSYEADIKHLKSRQIDFQKEIVSLKNDKSKLQNTNVKLKSSLEAQMKTIDNLTMECRKKTQERKTLCDSLSEKAKKFDLAEKELQKVKWANSSQKSKIKELKISHQSMETQLIEKCKALKQASSAAEQESSKHSERLEEVQEFKKQLSVSQETNKKIQKEIDETRAQYSKAIEDASKSTGEKERLKLEIVNLKSTVEELSLSKTQDAKVKSQLKTELGEARKELQELKPQLEDYSEKLSTSYLKIQNLEVNLKFTEGKIGSFEHEIETLREERNADLETLRKKEASIEKWKRKLDKATTKNAILGNELEGLKEHLESTVPKAKLDQVLQELETSQNAVASHQESAQEAEKQMLECRENDTLLKLEIKELKSRIVDAEESKNRLVGERNYFKKQAESMRVHVEKMAKVQVSVPQKQHSSPPSTELAQRDEKIFQLQKDVSNLQAEREGAKEAVKCLRRALDEHIHKSLQKKRKFKLFKAHSKEDPKALIRRNEQLQKLANELSDIIADQKSQIKHHKRTCELLGLENVNMKKSLGMKISTYQASENKLLGQQNIVINPNNT